MKERLLEEIQKGSKGAVMKKHIITYLIYNENSTITDLAKDMDLSIPTVTKIIDEMHEQGYIDEYGKLETNGGRHPILYGLNTDSGYFVGVDVTWNSINIGVINFKGEVLKLQMGIPFERSIIRKSKFPQNPKRSVRFSGKGTKRSVQKRKARNTQKAETKVL